MEREAAAVPAPFSDRLEKAIRERSTCLVVGIDPVLERLPREVLGAVNIYAPMRGDLPAANTARAAAALGLFSTEVIRAAAPFAVAAKPNAAFFERHGAAGWDALQMVCREARKRGLLVILDAKRGDLESTAAAYAEALLGDLPDTAGPEVDALTVNPYLGADGIQPFIAAARARGKGIFVLVRTSNPSAAEFQELESGGKPLYLHVAGAAARWGAKDIGASGLSLVGAVVGATAPDQARKIREVLPRAFFLVPGYGAQGGGAASVRPHFLPGGRGVIVNSSRSIIFAHEKEPSLPWTEAVRRAAEAARDELEAVRRAV